MNFYEILLIAIGLAMDSLAVSIASGAVLYCFSIKQAVRIALFMGFFQGLMPLLGWLVANNLHHYITDYDHWVAFTILGILGVKMIREGSTDKEVNCSFNPCKTTTLLVLSLATSIDALAVGVSFAFLRTDIQTPLIVIGLTTFILSFLGVAVGTRIRSGINKKIEIIGGLILLFIGIKILITHITTH